MINELFVILLATLFEHHSPGHSEHCRRRNGRSGVGTA